MHSCAQPAIADCMTQFLDELAPLSQALQPIWDKGQAQRPNLHIMPYEARLLQVLVRSCGAKRVIELGCFFGLSALAMAEALPEDGTLLTCEKDAECAATAREHFAQHPDGGKVTLHEGDAFEMIAQAEGLYDFAFIDAEKKSYPDYLEALLPKLRKGALIVIDNTLRRGAIETGVPEKGVSKASIDGIRKMHEMLKDRTRFEAVTLQTSDGMSIAVVL